MRLEIGAGSAAGRAGGVLWSSAILAAISPLDAAFTSQLPAPRPLCCARPAPSRFPPLPASTLFLPRPLCSLLVCPRACLSLWSLFLHLLGCMHLALTSFSSCSRVSRCLSRLLSRWVSASPLRCLSVASAICQLLLFSLLFLPLTLTPCSGGCCLHFSLYHHMITASGCLCSRLLVSGLLHPSTFKPFPSSRLAFSP